MKKLACPLLFIPVTAWSQASYPGYNSGGAKDVVFLHLKKTIPYKKT
jgi:hypothetical protein